MATLKERLTESWRFADEKIGHLNTARKLFVLLDSAWERYVHGANKVDYFQYGFYFKRRPAREQFVTISKLRTFHRTLNDKSKSRIFADKAAFAATFAAYMGRDILDMNSASREMYDRFTAKHDRMFVKPRDGTYGKGVELLECSAPEAAYDKLFGKNVLLEEVIRQHPDMAAYNDSSLNSLRVVTLLRANGEPVLLPGSAVRFGRKGRIADNFHHGGVAAQIDNDTGIVVTKGIDKAGCRYTVHPDSGLPVVGFRIPLWDEIRRTVLAAAKVVPEVRYVGWDVAVTDDGRVILVEGNDRADPDLSQMSSDVGQWPVFKKYLDEFKAAKKNAS